MAAAALLIAFSILVRRINHDEGQYVAAIALVRGALPYRDFAYLQTPLQPLMFRPLSRLPAGWLLLGARLTNGLFGLVTVGLLLITLRERASARSSAIAIVAFLCSEPFLLASSLARNDALPMALLAAAILALLRAMDEERGTRWFALAGLLFGLAASAKINAGVSAGAAALFLLPRRQGRSRPLIAFGIGGLAGLVPTIVLAAIAPAQFLFDVFAYNVDAPRQWWTAVGHGNWFDPGYRLLRLMAFAGLGCGGIGTAAAAFDRRLSDDRRLLDYLVVGGLVGAYLPEPTFTQYLVPLLPPVAVRFALAIDNLPRRRHALLHVSTAASCVLGLILTIHYGLRAASNGDDLVEAIEQGRQIAAAAGGAPIATLSPERVAGSNTNLDRGFVTGPFLFRTFGPLSADALRYGYSPNWQRIDRALDLNPPAVILTGGEAAPFRPLFPRGLDEAMISWAKVHRYTGVQLEGDVLLWTRPKKAPA
jgi:4-amino-4-deoxy-L-arabinose transferase-like glycosyltransferase